MRIAVLCHPTAGGSGVVATELALAMAGLGHDVHVVATQPPFRLSERRLPRATPGADAGVGEVYFHQVDAGHYPLFEQPITSLAASNLLAEVVEEYGVEIIHAHYAIPHATNALLARDMLEANGSSVKVLTTLHGTDVTLVGLEPAFARSTRFAIQASDGVTAVSEYLARHTREAMSVDAPIRVIHNWVDPDRFRPIRDPAYRARFALDGEAILMHVSNFRAVKRPQDVVRVFAGVSARRRARLLLVGDGPERSVCFELARRLGVADRVHFLGSLPAVESVLGVADAFLLPSAKESFGLVALEAMACGAPVVCSDAGGLPEVVVDGETGAIREVGDVDGMIDATLALLEDPERHDAVGRRARERAVTQFNPARILPSYVRAYEDVLGR